MLCVGNVEPRQSLVKLKFGENKFFLTYHEARRVRDMIEIQLALYDGEDVIFLLEELEKDFDS